MSDFDIAQPDSPIVQNFAISIWFSLLFAVSFAGAIFGLFGTSAALAMLFIGFFCSLVTLWFAYQKRHIKDAYKVPADALAILGLIFFFVTLFEADLVVALVEMLFFLQLALNLYFREHRQVYFGLIACFVALMTGAIYTYRTGFLLFIFLFCLCACFYLALCYVDKKLSLSGEQPKPSQQPERSKQDIPENNNLNQTSSVYGSWTNLERIGIAVAISLLAGIIYLIMPRFPAGHVGKLPLEGWGKYQNAAFEKQLLPEDADLSDAFYKTPQEEPADKSQTPDDISANEQNSPANLPSNPDSNEQDNSNTDNQNNDSGNGTSQYARDGSIYFYVKSNRSRYLQVQVKTYFDGASWYALQYGRKRLKEDQGLYWLYGGKPNTTIDIKVAQNIPEHIAVTDNTLAVHFPSEHIGRDYYDNLKAGKTLKEGTFYQLHLEDEYKHGRLIDTKQAMPDSRDLQLPRHLDRRISELANTVTKGATSDWQKAVMLEQHLRTSYNYSLSTLWNQNNIPLTDFLFGKKTGHCEYFATAMAMMLRTQNIPARMVTGLVAEDYNPVTGFYEVKGTNAHAWVEAYVDGAWVIFEATGAYQPPKEKEEETDEANTAHNQLKEYLENLNQQAEQLDEIQEDKSLLEQLTSLLREFWYGLLLLLESLLKGVLNLIKSLWFMLVLLPVAWFTWRFIKNKFGKSWQDNADLRRLKRVTSDDPKTIITQSMDCIQSMLARHGVIRDSGMTVEDFAEQLSQQQLLVTEHADQLHELIDQHFYAATSQRPPQANTQSPTSIQSFFVLVYQSLQQTIQNKL